MDKVRFGVIGLGNMGSYHSTYLPTMDHATLGAVCDTDKNRLDKAKAKVDVPVFAHHQEMLNSGLVDAVIIAVPHYDHVPIALDAMAKNIHVLCEKPIAVSVKAARNLNETYRTKYSHLKFGMVFQRRTSPVFKKVKELIKDGEIGEISRITWVATNWFRTWAYYASGGWRATWLGEGGGVLINQCPHNMDMIQHLMGAMPTRVTAVAYVGKRHPIEVEDEVSAILEYPNGAIGHFVTSTGEAPGTDRLEIAGDRGKLVVENGKIKFTRTRQLVQDFNRTNPQLFASPETWDIDVLSAGEPEDHKLITRNFVDVVYKNLPNENLIAPGPEGVRGLELGNAILMAGLTRQPVTLPVDGDAYDAFIRDMAKQYGGKKKLETKENVAADMAASFVKT